MGASRCYGAEPNRRDPPRPPIVCARHSRHGGLQTQTAAHPLRCQLRPVRWVTGCAWPAGPARLSRGGRLQSEYRCFPWFSFSGTKASGAASSLVSQRPRVGHARIYLLSSLTVALDLFETLFFVHPAYGKGPTRPCGLVQTSCRLTMGRDACAASGESAY